jgi:ubiquinone/menaquinone biosynthesis C-methylase UbiE
MKNLLLSLAILAISIPVCSRAVDEPPQGQRSGSYWLQPVYEREREAYEKKRDADYQEVRVLDIAGVEPGMIVGEVGAGNGYFSLKLARRIGPSGKVFANDIVEDFLAEIRDRSKQQNLSNIETILGTETDPRLPAGSLDMVFMIRVLHDLTKPVQVLEKVTASLKPGAKVIVVETEDKEQDGKRSLQTRQQFLDVIARSPFVVERIDKSLPNPRSVVFILVPR